MKEKWRMDDEVPPMSQDDLPPDLRAKLRIVIPGYELIDIIGRGGQATVYKGVDAASGQKVAIKVLHDGPFAHDSARQRLQRESITLKALSHPNIVCFLRSGTSPTGHEFLIMNYVEGRTLDQYWQDMGTMPENRADPAALLKLFARICLAVGAAHRSGITHRDLSPRNILVDHAGEPHILDFGLARSAFDAFLQPGKPEISFSGEFIGKFAYASPEQALGKNDAIDIRTDVYSLGVILYQILTGGLFPYEVGSGMAQTLKHIVESEPTPPSKLLASLAKEEKPRKLAKRHPPVVNEVIERIVLKTLEKEPARRYQSAGELGQDIEAYLAGKPTTAIRQREAEARHGLRWQGPVVVGGVVVVVVLALLWWMGRARGPTPISAPAQAPVAIEPRVVAASVPASTPRESGGTVFPEEVFSGHTGHPTSIVLLPERNMLVTGADSLYRVQQGRAFVNYPGNDNTVRFWDLRSGRQTSMIKAGLGTWGIHSLHASADGSSIVAATGHIGPGFGGFIISAWRTDNQQMLRSFHLLPPLAARSAEFSPDGEILFSLQADSILRTMNLKTGAEGTSGPLVAGDGAAHDVGNWCMSSDRRQLFGARVDNGVISLWNVADGKRVRDFFGHTEAVRTLGLSQDDRFLLSGSNDGTLRVWEVASGKEISQCRTGPVVAAAFVGAGHGRAVTGGNGHEATLWDLATGKVLKTFSGHTDSITALAVSRDGRLLATASADLTARTWVIPEAAGVEAGATIDLLKLADAARDVRAHGKWVPRDGRLVSAAPSGNELEFPYAVGAEYDYRVTFVPPAGVSHLMFFAPAGGHQIAWIAGARENTACGIDLVEGKEAAQNITTRWGTQWIVPGRANTVVLKVRQHHFMAILNGETVCDYETDYHEIALPEWVKWKRGDTPGLMFNVANVAIESAEIVEVAGEGKRVGAAGV